MKKLFVVILVIALLASLCACTAAETQSGTDQQSDSAIAETKSQESTDNDTAGSDEKTELTVWCWTQEFNLLAIREANKIYQKDHPNVNVTPIEVPWDDLQPKLITMLTAGQYDELPDIILMQDNSGQKNISLFPDAFYDLTDSIDFSEFPDYKVGSFTVDGRIYGVPFDNGVTANFLRTDYLEEAGYTIDDFNDITWQEYYEIGVDVFNKTGKSIAPIDKNKLEMVSTMLQGSGSWYFDKDGNVTIADNQVLHDCIELVVKMTEDGVLKPVADWNELTSALSNGTVAGVVSGAWMISCITPAEDQSGLWAIANTPKMAGVEGAVNSSSNGGSSWMVLNSSPNKEVAADFLDKTFNGSAEFYQNILKDSGAIATWGPAAKGELYSEPHEFFGGQVIYEDIIEWSKDVPSVRGGMYIFEALDAVSVAFQEVLNGADIWESLAKAEENVEFLMKE